ncbi:MAG: hypothetical protein EBT84_09825 [Sphingomonadaceae bacterium]|nr:hypothetical protein [Sphingomonadaceae bacterium]
MRADIDAALVSWPIKPRVVSGDATKYHNFRKARAALAASGTVTLELALAHVPMVVGYRVGAIESHIRHFISVPSIVLANLIIGEQIIPEFIQGDCRPDRLAEHLVPLLRESEARHQQMRGFDRLDQLMAINDQNPSAKAAEVIARYIY